MTGRPWRGGGAPRTSRRQEVPGLRVSSTRSVSVSSYWNGSVLRLPDNLPRCLVEYASEYHTPVMVGEVLHYLDPTRGGLYLDGTLGGGGHSAAILAASSDVRVVGIDQDREALAEARSRLSAYGERFRAVEANFADAISIAGLEAGSLSGALLDLGISSHQIDELARGFTFRPGAPLDMRMGGSAGLESAAELLNRLEEEELALLFRRFGEERRSRHLARIVVELRNRQPLRTSDDLVEAIERAIPRATVQDRARIFQAVRIAVNREIEVLETVLPRIREALAPGGVLVVLSYHSLEDRIVKDSFREWSRSCVCPPGLPICVCRGAALGVTLTRKPVMASPAEVAVNPRARSARLRAWRKA